MISPLSLQKSRVGNTYLAKYLFWHRNNRLPSVQIPSSFFLLSLTDHQRMLISFGSDRHFSERAACYLQIVIWKIMMFHFLSSFKHWLPLQLHVSCSFTEWQNLDNRPWMWPWSSAPFAKMFLIHSGRHWVDRQQPCQTLKAAPCFLPVLQES